MKLSFENITSPILLEGCDEMASLIRSILCDWGVEVTTSEAAPAMTIRKTSIGYERTAPWLKKPAVFSDAVDATCDLAADLIRLYTNDNKLLCLHAGAVQFPGGLVIFPDSHRKGKSTLSGLLAYNGHRLFSDDVLPIEKNGHHGEAIGILPRVRMPLPQTISKDFSGYVDDTTVIRNNRYCYFGQCGETAAEKGTLAPIHAIVMLDRKEGQKTTLEPSKGSDTLARLITQNFGATVPAPETLDRLHHIVMNAETFILHYDEGGNAVPLLQERFGRGA